MDLHANAVLTVRQRQRVCDLVATGVTITAAALVVGCSRQTASKWVNRRRRGESLSDRSSRPQRSPRRTPASVEQAILRARSRASRGAARDRLGARCRCLDRARRPSPPRTLATGHARCRARRSSATSVPRPGELVHVDIKKLSRIVRARPPRDRRSLEAEPRAPAGSTCTWRSTTTPDSASPRSIPTRRPTPRSPSSTSSSASTRSHGIRVERVLTDNGPASSGAGRRPASARGSRSRRRAPIARRPTARPSASSAPCSSAGRTPTPTSTSQSVWPLWPPALDFYNRFRPHRALGGLTPLQRVNNLPGTYT